MNKLVVSIAALCLAGCAGTPPAGVFIVEASDVEGCKALSMVSNDAMHDLNIATATNDVLNEAKKVGGNRVVMQAHEDRSGGLLGEIRMIGTAYYCDE